MGNALIADPGTEVSKVIGLLKKSDAYEVFYLQAGRALMATIRDLLNAKNLTTSKLENIANTVPKLSAEEKLGNAVRILSDYRIRALPVIEKGKIVGALHVKDVVEAMEPVVPNAKVSAIMTPHPITISSDDSVLKAKGLMLRRKIDHLPVLKNEKLVGMVDSSEILYATIPPERQSAAVGAKAVGTKRMLDYPVDGIMDTTPLEFELNDSIQKSVGQMLKMRANAALVTWAHELQGIVTLRDIVKILVEEPKQPPSTYIVGLPDDPFEAETAKTKFSRIISTISKSMDIVEARATIKILKTLREKERRRYEVKVSIATRSNVYNFSKDGAQLSDIFDELQQRIRRINVKRPKIRPTQRKPAVLEE
jgi:CBS domain-containing protein